MLTFVVEDAADPYLCGAYEFFVKKPCTGAYDLYAFQKDIRTVDDPAKVRAYGGDSNWWYSKGENHRVENGQIVRDFKREVWFISFQNLEDFSEFIENYCPVSITDGNIVGYKVLTINDH